MPMFHRMQHVKGGPVNDGLVKKDLFLRNIRKGSFQLWISKR